jgi:hypothetical protein
MCKEIPADGKNQVLGQISHPPRAVVGQETGDDGHQQGHGARAIEDLRPAERGVI